MYHIARVNRVIRPDGKNSVSADKRTVAVLKTWDENILILVVDEAIEEKIKEKDYVLADYRLEERLPGPRQVITKILPESVGKEIWNIYTDHLEDLKRRSGVQATNIEKPHQYG